MENRALVERVFEFQNAVKRKSAPLASRISSTLIPLLEYAGSLETASPEELLKISGIGPSTVTYFTRIFRGEDITSVVKDVPRVIIVKNTRAYSQTKDTGNWDGSTDNAVRIYEGG